MAKSLPANAGVVGDAGSIPGSGSFPWRKKQKPAGVQPRRVQEHLRDEWCRQKEVHGLWLQCKNSSTLFFNSSDYIELFVLPPPYHHPMLYQMLDLCFRQYFFFPMFFPYAFTWNIPYYRVFCLNVLYISLLASMA